MNFFNLNSAQLKCSSSLTLVTFQVATGRNHTGPERSPQQRARAGVPVPCFCFSTTHTTRRRLQRDQRATTTCSPTVYAQQTRPSGCKQVACGNTRTSDKTHSEDPESSHLKTGKHVTWALFTCLSLEQCALVRRQEALRCTRPVPGCVHSFPRDAALRSGAVSPAEKFCPKRKSHPPLKTKPTASSAQLATRTT